jgi:hypothetical protein
MPCAYGDTIDVCRKTLVQAAEMQEFDVRSIHEH